MKRVLFFLLIFSKIVVAEGIYATFDVVARKDAKLAFSASGSIQEVYVDVGDFVKKGEVLAKIDNRDLKALLDRSYTLYKYAKREYERTLKIKKFIDEAKFDSVAKAYESAKASYMYQKALFDKTFLKAPFDGVIYFKDIEVGDAVSGMMLKTVFKIQSTHERKVLLYFDQKYANSIKVGDRFVFTIDSKEYSLPIVKIYPASNPKNRKITAEAYAKDLLVGLYGSGSIVTKEK